MSFIATWMNLVKSDKDKYHIISFTGRIKEKTTTTIQQNYLQNRNRLTTLKTNLWLPKWKHGGRDKLEGWDQQIHTTIYKIDNQQGPTA